VNCFTGASFPSRYVYCVVGNALRLDFNRTAHLEDLFMPEQFQHRASAVPVLSAVVCAVVLASTAHLAQAADPLVIRNYNQTAAAGDYWTPARMTSAQPMDLPRASGQGRAIGASDVPERRATSSDAHAPLGEGEGTVTLHDPVSGESLTGEDVDPSAVNPSGQRFTNARVVPMDVLRGQYPWQTVEAVLRRR
jgi:hypothetical protein